MLKILFIVYDISKEGGNSLQALKLATQISLLGHEIIIITTNVKKNQKMFLEKNKIRVYTTYQNKNQKINSLTNQFKFIKSIKFIASREKIDLIQLYDPISTGFLGLYSKVKFRKPMVIRLGTIFEKFYIGKMKNIFNLSNEILNTIIKSFLEYGLKFYCFIILMSSKSVISNSYFINNYYKHYTINSKMYTIHNGVDLVKFTLKDNRPFDFDYALYVGRIEPRKSIEMIITAYSKLPEITRPKKLLVIGDYEYDQRYTQNLFNLIERLELEKQVIFKGFVNPNFLHDYYSNARYTIFSSNNWFFPMTEGLPNVILEGMASGSLIVASNVAGVAEVIKNGVNGFLFNSHSINELKNTLSKLDKAGEKYRNKIKDNARNFVSINLDFRKISKKYIKIYKNLLD